MSLPDLQVRMRPGGMYKAESAPAVTASCAWLRPYSAGSVPLRPSDPHDPPKMVATFLTDVRDVPPLIEGIRVIRRIFDEPPFAQPFKGGTLRGIEFRTDEQPPQYLTANARSMYHPVGTCGMGSRDDVVVDHELRVRGIEGLRVVDASVMPGIPSGNTNAPTIMIAEEALDMILASESAPLVRIPSQKETAA